MIPYGVLRSIGSNAKTGIIKPLSKIAFEGDSSFSFLFNQNLENNGEYCVEAFNILTSPPAKDVMGR